jgi:hypothetical protein
LKSLEAVQLGEAWHVLSAEYRMKVLSYILRYVSFFIN